MVKKAKALVRGRVQGVFFRYYTRKCANELSLTGYAKNMPDGSVEVIFEGENLEEGLSWLNQGSPQSHVENLEVNRYEGDREYQDFTIQ